jgi:hypothetical protein
MNRFDWEMRYPDAHGVDGESHLAGGSLRGPLATPGNYRVKLTSDSGTEEQTFAILKDPRLATTDAEYQEQFRFETSVRDRLSEADDDINQIRRVLARLKSAGAQVAAVQKQLDDLLHELWEPRYTGYDDQMLVFPLKLNNRIAALANYAEGGFAPTDQDKQVLNELSAELERLTTRMKRLMETPGVSAQ